MAIPPKTPLLVQLSVEGQHAAQVRKVLTMSANRLDKDIKKLGKSGNPITRMQMEAQRASIHAMLEQDFADIHKAVAQGKIAAAKAASGVVSQYENQLLKTVMSQQAMQNLAISEAKRAAGGLDALMKRVSGTSHIPLSKQVYKTQQMTLGWVDARINQALVSGWSAAKLAAEVKGMIDPNVKGGVSYAANRLARTEINNSFHASSAERYANSVIVEGVDWNLSTSHPEGDECDTMADDSPYKKNEVPKKPHPHCYCFITPALPSEEEFLNKLFDGDYDEGQTFVEVMKADPSPTFNTLAKRYKIKGSVLESSGATPTQLQDLLKTMAPKDVTALKKLPPHAQQHYWDKAAGKTAAKTAQAAAKATAPKTQAAAQKVEAKIQDAKGDWLNKAAPVKPKPPVKPPTVGDKAFDEWEKKVAQRFADFAKANGNAKTDITKSLNYPQIKLVRESNMNALDSLKANHYIDDALYAEAKLAMKESAKMLPKDATAFKKALATHAKETAQFDADLVEWRSVNGIVSNAKGMDGAIIHKTNAEGVKWANANMKIAPDGPERRAAYQYSGSSYSSWNADLRAKASLDLPDGKFKTSTANLDAAMAPLPEDVILHRGTNWDEFEIGGKRNNRQIPPPPPTDLIGSVQTNHGYTSTSVGNSSAFTGGMKMRIRVPSGHNVTWVDPYSAHKGEREVLMSRSTSMYVHDVYKEGNRWIMDVEVVPIGQDASVWTPMPGSHRI